MTTADCHSKTLFNKNHNFLIGLLLLLAVLSAYIPAIQGGYIWDDPMHVTENPLLKNSDGLRRIWFEPGAWAHYYPLTLTSFWIEYQIWGLAPLGYHLINVLLHVLNAFLAWRVLLRLQVPGALFAAAVFALHPVHVESVAWVSERKNVLSGFFYLSALSIYLRFALRGNGIKGVPATPTKNSIQPSGRYYKGLYTLSLGLYLCALLSKTITCTLPAVILALLWWQRDQIKWRDVQALIPMFLVGVALGINTIFMERSAGAQGTEWAFSFTDRCLIAGRALWFYAGKLVWPDNLIFTYPRWQIDSGLWWQYLYPLAALAVMFTLWMIRGRIGKAPIVAVLIFSGTLLPALGFINYYPMRFSFVADHFQYLASISLIAVFASIAATAFKKYIKGKYYIGLAGGLAVLVVLGILTFSQGHIYENVETLYRDTLTKNPNSWMAHNNLGAALLERGDIDDAIAHYKKALRLFPDYFEARTSLAGALLERGDIDGAIAHYKKALRIVPDYVDARNNLGAALQKQGNIDDAIAHYMESLRIEPDSAGAHNNLGTALKEQGDIAGAIAHYREALRIKPDYAGAHNNLGLALIEQDNINDAIKHYLEALRINPDYEKAHNNLAIALCRKNNFTLALRHFRKAVEINPNYHAARNNLNKLLLQQKNSQ